MKGCPRKGPLAGVLVLPFILELVPGGVGTLKVRVRDSPTSIKV